MSSYCLHNCPFIRYTVCLEIQRSCIRDTVVYNRIPRTAAETSMVKHCRFSLNLVSVLWCTKLRGWCTTMPTNKLHKNATASSKLKTCGRWRQIWRLPKILFNIPFCDSILLNLINSLTFHWGKNNRFKTIWITIGLRPELGKNLASSWLLCQIR